MICLEAATLSARLEAAAVSLKMIAAQGSDSGPFVAMTAHRVQRR